MKNEEVFRMKNLKAEVLRLGAEGIVGTENARITGAPYGSVCSWLSGAGLKGGHPGDLGYGWSNSLSCKYLRLPILRAAA